MDSIDVQDLVDWTESFIAKRMIDFILAQAIIAAPWLGWALINPVARGIIEAGVNLGIKFLDGIGFNLNTDIVTTDQGSDYRKTIVALIKAPDDIPDAEWERLENEANHKFDELVRLSKSA